MSSPLTMCNFWMPKLSRQRKIIKNNNKEEGEGKRGLCRIQKHEYISEQEEQSGDEGEHEHGGGKSEQNRVCLMPENKSCTHKKRNKKEKDSFLPCPGVASVSKCIRCSLHRALDAGSTWPKNSLKKYFIIIKNN